MTRDQRASGITGRPTMTNENRELSFDELACVSAAAMDGISYLVAVTQMKANNANDAALSGASTQQGLVHGQRAHRPR
jgi:hypothetical protein